MLVRFVATDEAGNQARHEVVVISDQEPPRIRVEPTSFVSEENMAAVVAADGSSVSYQMASSPRTVELGESGWPLRFAKYFTRLDALGSPSGSNTPVLTLAIDDAAALAGENAPERLEYRYLVNGSTKRAWAEVTRDPDARYRIPIAYQALGQELARVTPTDTNTIEVRARDAAGNVAVREFPFVLQVMTPPVWFGRCDLAETVTSLSVRAHNLHGLFGGSDVEVTQGVLRFPTGLPTGSMAPDPGLMVRATASPMESRITRLDFQKLTAGRSARTWYYGRCPVPATWFDDQCQPGIFPEQGVHWDESHGQDNWFAVTNYHPMTTTLTVAGGSIASMMNETPLPLDQSARVGLVAVSPRYQDRDGSVYAWTDVPSIPSGFSSWNPPGPRYFAPMIHAEGKDVTECEGYGCRPGHADERNFTTLVHVTGFRVNLSMPNVHATHRAMPGLYVPIVVDASCRADKSHVSSF